MYIAVQAFLNSTSATVGLTALAEKLALLTTLITEILKLAGTQAEPTDGELEAREIALTEATDLALIVAGGVRSYARKLPELAARVRVTRTAFREMRRTERMRLAQRIHDAAASVLPELAGYGVTAALLAELQLKIDATIAAVNAPRVTSGVKKVATSQLLGLYKQVDDLLADELDPLLLSLRRNDPHAWELYRDARKVFDRPGARSDDDEKSGSAPVSAAPATPTPTLTT